METSPRILNMLLVICSITLASSLVLAGYFVFQRGEIQSLKNRLLNENELQAELLRAQPLDHSLLPHSVNEIGYVLNPNMKRSTWHAHEGESYPINSLGLRGQEIAKKQAGSIRILVVGDSMVFGWKLKEEDRLSNILNKYTSERIANGESIEFLTIGLPGWNVRSERAFLESHLRLLDPDLVVWWSIPNDIEDVAGVIPPGMLASWASGQMRNQSPFTRLSSQNMRSGAVMPSIAERMAENVELIASFQLTHDIPVVLLGLPAFDEIQRDISFDPPWIYVPQVYWGERWRISDSDRHPSPWANHIIAIGVLRELIQLKIIPELEFAEADMTIVQNYAKEEERRFNEAQSDSFSSWAAQVPSIYKLEDGRQSKSILYGINRNGELAKAGTLFLRDADNSSHVIISLALPDKMGRYPGAVRFSIRNRNYEESDVTVKLDSGHAEVTLALPKMRDDIPVYEISWVFDFLNCKTPSNCSAGKLLQVGFGQ